MSKDDAMPDSSLDYALREYRRLFDEARRGERPWDHRATVRALAEKTGVTVEEIEAGLGPSASRS
ncbi:hypothetical protein [Microvirga thermotolerans]|uniref:Uncharacterized protein n=1 Tax=Microvirga thermotolerans TaxID=2651334 RepID=A0A5P9JT53_9HYPH|nr:hypothetical protein [Microvirga thermotolerans]QFU15992.1 hypothetical protein GDR74_07010 [Microvirga thermotolerans]